jgi:hypothetical protein
VYYGGAAKVTLTQTNSARIDDEHSFESPSGWYSISATADRCILTLNVDDSINQVNPPMMTGEYMGKVKPYEALGVDLYAPDVDKDYFGNSRGSGRTTLPGPFADLKAGTNTYTLWPLN